MAYGRGQLYIESFETMQFFSVYRGVSRMSHGKQAKMLTPKQETAVLTSLQTRRYPIRDRVIFFVVDQSRVTAKSCPTHLELVTDAAGQVVEAIALPKRASKGHRGGRLIPLNNLLRAALVE